ncbi:hypothetical protein CO641_13035 [Lysobacteraceae bacterium NML91-0213]|nr:hypothetical protein CO641_13035 [Xanthomonadaceae bacterium NML91-0213]
MAKPKNEQYEVDPCDGLPRGVVGAWSYDKHQRLKRYVYASHGARRKYRDDYGRETSFVDLYCGPGRARIRGSVPEEVIDGSALAAARIASTCTPYSRYLVGDLDPDLVMACSTRLRSLGISAIDPLVGPANKTANMAASKLDPRGLHFALVDPFNADLPFATIEALGSLAKMDQLIHFSIMDLRRNFQRMKDDGRLDSLAPGWQLAIKSTMSIDTQRMAIFAYWRSLLEKRLRYTVSDKIVKVRGPQGAEIYWLVLASRHPLAGRLWKEVSDLSPTPQREMFG